MIGKAALIAGQGIGPGQIIPDEYTVGALRGLLVKRLVDHVRFDIPGDPARPTGPGLVLSDTCQPPASYRSSRRWTVGREIPTSGAQSAEPSTAREGRQYHEFRAWS